MFRKASRLVTVLAAVTLVTAWLAVPSSASTRSQVQGVTDEEIQVVLLVPDLDTLIARGFNVGALSNKGFAERFTAHFDKFGPINGRKIVPTIVGWDPLDSTSYSKACIQATQDNKPFVIVNGTGYRDTAYPCVTVENDTPYVSGDFADAEMQEAGGKNLVLLSLPPEVAAANAVRMLAKTGQLPKSAKIGIMVGNTPGLVVTGDTLEKELKKRGYNVASRVNINNLSSDPNAAPRESTQAVATFQAQGVDTVINTMSTTLVGSFFSEAVRANYKPTVYSIDGQQSLCTQGAAPRTPVEADGMICITTFDGPVGIDGKSLRPDNAFEAECRETWETFKGVETTPNGPSGGGTIGGVKYGEDIAPFECTIANLLLPAMKKAGKSLTWAKVHKNLMANTKAPAAYMSNGEGGFGANKPYLANEMHFVKLHRADASTPKDANGMYNGCPIPAPCFVPFEVDGQEWFPIKTANG